MGTLRLDKLLSQSGQYSRREAGRLIREGLAEVDGVPQRDPARPVDPGCQTVTLRGEEVTGGAYRYYLLHKPAGLLTAARDSRAPTVMTLVPPALTRRKVMPVGRLDRDTTGLLLLTNDGELAHRLLSPRRHVDKTYWARVRGLLTREDVLAFARGIPLSDFVALPAKARILSADPDESEALLTLREGKYHQVKRMFAARGHEVLSLRRVAFGPLRLPEDLPPGAYRELTPAEADALREAAGLTREP